MTRREYVSALLSLPMMNAFSALATNQDDMLKRTIPSSGEKLPAVGVGTWQTFDVSDSAAETEPLKEVLKNLIAQQGTVIDSSPMYGRSESVVGKLSVEAGVNEKLFIATKVWTTGERAGIDQMNESFGLLRRQKMDLMQIHNLVDWQTHLKTLKKWKEEGKVRYIGYTHYTDSSHEMLIEVMKKNPVDFVQFNYNLTDRHAEEKILPYARDHGVAVLINRPYAEGALFRLVKGKSVPEWASAFDCHSWGQFFLKYILAEPAVTCVIPGTSKLTHLLDNLGAGLGRLPDSSERKRMIQVVQG